MEAVKQKGRALQHTSEQLRGDREVPSAGFTIISTTYVSDIRKQLLIFQPHGLHFTRNMQLLSCLVQATL